MTVFASHRFSVGQRVAQLGEISASCEVLALVDSAEGLKYRIKSDRGPEAILAERDLTYSNESARTGRRSVH